MLDREKEKMHRNNGTHQWEKKDTYSKLLIAGRQEISFIEGRDVKTERQVRSLYSKQRRRLKVRPHWRLWAERAGNALNTAKVSYVTNSESMFGFLLLILNWKRAKKCKLIVSAQVLGPLLERLWFDRRASELEFYHHVCSVHHVLLYSAFQMASWKKTLGTPMDI